MNKTLFITGGNGEIGQAIINLFKLNGYLIIAPNSNEMDCSDVNSINSFFENNDFGQINAIVHSAGWNEPKEFDKITTEEMMKSIMINSFSLLTIIQKLNSHLIDNTTKILAISSIYGFLSRNKRLSYTSSKHSINGIIKELSIELGSRRILSNCVSPGFVKTKMTYKNNSEMVINDIISKIPLQRLADSSEVAHIVYFLCSEANTYINGQNIIIDGGYSVGGFQNN